MNLYVNFSVKKTVILPQDPLSLFCGVRYHFKFNLRENHNTNINHAFAMCPAWDSTLDADGLTSSSP